MLIIKFLKKNVLIEIKNENIKLKKFGSSGIRYYFGMKIEFLNFFKDDKRGVYSLNFIKGERFWEFCLRNKFIILF